MWPLWKEKKKEIGQEDYAGWLMTAACWAEMWSLAMFSKVHNNMSWSDLWCCWHFFWVDAFSQMPIRLEAWTPTMNDGSGVEGLSNFAELPLSFTSFLKSQAGGQVFSHQGLLELFAEECACCSQAVGHKVLILRQFPGARQQEREEGAALLGTAGTQRQGSTLCQPACHPNSQN